MEFTHQELFTIKKALVKKCAARSVYMKIEKSSEFKLLLKIGVSKKELLLAVKQEKDPFIGIND